MKKFRGAIVGFGKVAAEAHLLGFRQAPGYEVVAAVDPSPQSREAASQAGLRAYKTFAAMIEAEEKLEFVDVAAPPRAHAPAVTEALEANFHVLCEKPLARNAAELAELQRVARRSGRSLFTVHNWKYAPLIRRLRGLVTAGTVGEPSEVEWTVLRPSAPEGVTADGATWRLDPELAGGGILMDHGWHAFYLMLFLLGREPLSITANLRNERPEALSVEDTADCTIDFGGCLARIHLSWAAAERRTGGLVRGPLGQIEIEDEMLIVSVANRPADRMRFSPALSASSYHPEWFPPLLEDFRGEILHADRRGRNLAEAARCSQLMTAAYASAGQPVSLIPATESQECPST